MRKSRRLAVALLVAAGISPVQGAVIAPGEAVADASMAAGAANAALTLRGFFQSSAPDLASLSGAASFLGQVDLKNPAVHAAMEPVRAEIAAAVQQAYRAAPDHPAYPDDADSDPNQRQMFAASEKIAVLNLPVFGPYLSSDDRANLRDNAELYRRSLTPGNSVKLEAKMNAIAAALAGNPVLETGTALVIASASNDPFRETRLQRYDGSRLRARLEAQRILDQYREQRAAYERALEEASMRVQALKSRVETLLARGAGKDAVAAAKEELLIAKRDLKKIEKERLRLPGSAAVTEAVETMLRSGELDGSEAGGGRGPSNEVRLVPLGSGRAAGAKASGLKLLSVLTAPFRAAPFRFAARVSDQIRESLERSSFDHPLFPLAWLVLGPLKLLNFIGDAAHGASSGALPPARVLPKAKEVKQLASGSEPL